MRRFILTVALALMGMAVPAAAEAAEGYTTGNVNLRAGPGTQYPRVVTLPRNASVEVYGCLRGYSWCDVGAFGTRGWVSSRYLSIFYDERVYVPSRPQVRVPSVTFGFGYWDRWYSDRPWYRDRDRWRDRDWADDRGWRDRDWRDRDRDRDRVIIVRPGRDRDLDPRWNGERRFTDRDRYDRDRDRDRGRDGFLIVRPDRDRREGGDDCTPGSRGCPGVRFGGDNQNNN